MLIGIDKRVTAELLYCLASLGHGDEIVVADANFPSHSTAEDTNWGTPIELPGMSATEAIELITQLMPLDDFLPDCALRMQEDGKPNALTDVHREVFAVLDRVKPAKAGLGSMERQDFYVRARKAYAVIRTGESRAYGCFILGMGVVF